MSKFLPDDSESEEVINITQEEKQGRDWGKLEAWSKNNTLKMN